MTVRRAEVIHRHRDRPAVARGSAHLRLPWIDVGQPATPACEAAFVADLRIAAEDGIHPHRRSDVTAVLNALRGGLTVDRLLDIAPGLRPARLLAAYAAVEAKRAASERAWLAIVDQPTPVVVARYASEALRVLPIPVELLTDLVDAWPSGLDRAVGRASDAVRATARRIHRLERELDAGPAAERAMELGALLFDHTDRCAYAADHHLPSRVGSLVPSRVAALLSECRRNDHHIRNR